MYYRLKNDVRIDWQPEDEAIAFQAMEEMQGPDEDQDVPESASVPENCPIELTEIPAQRVRERYDELYEEKHGYPTGFTPNTGPEDEE